MTMKKYMVRIGGEGMKNKIMLVKMVTYDS